MRSAADNPESEQINPTEWYPVPAFAAFAPFDPNQPLPVIKFSNLEPRSKDGWTAEYLIGFEFRGQTVGDGEPFATDEFAWQFAEAWLKDQFGPLPAGSTWKRDAISPPYTGVSLAKGVDDVEHTLTFTQLYRSAHTERFATVYLRGKSVASAYVHAAQITELPWTARPVISAESARAEFRKLVEPQGEQALAEFDKFTGPSLFFAYTRPAQEQKDGESFAGPNWAFEVDPSMLVNAYTGKLWRND